jgi:hypothetical protein
MCEDLEINPLSVRGFILTARITVSQDEKT